MDTLIVGADQEGADRCVEFGERQPGRARRSAVDEMTGQLGQQLCVQRAEQTLDLAAALWASDAGENQLETQVRRDVLEVGACEVAAVVDMKDVRQATKGPVGVRLAPDCLPQPQRGLHCGRRPEEDGVAGNGARVVVNDRGQPGPRGFAVRIDDKDVEAGVVGLPERVRPLGAVAVDQLEAVTVGGRALQREGDHPRVQVTDDGMDAAERGCCEAVLFGGGADPTMDRSDRGTGTA